MSSRTAGDAGPAGGGAELSSRTQIGEARRVVVKIGSSSLTHPGGGLDTAAVTALADVVAGVCAGGRQVLVVTSAAIAAALTPLGLKQRPRDLATQQAAASVGQGALMAAYATAFAPHELVVGQVLLTEDDMARRAHYRNAQRTLNRLLAMGVVPIVNENDTVATDEIRFGDNDRLAAMVAHLVHADALILLSDVVGLFDGPPTRAGARFIPEVRRRADLSGLDLDRRGPSGTGTGGMRSKVESASMAAAAGVPVVLTEATSLRRALAGESVGTLFHVTGKRVPTRLLWLEHAASTSGAVVLDAGAVRAVVRGRKSLLPAGIVAVRGDFEAGDPVDLLTESGHIAARGLVNFDSTELPGLLGRSTRDLARELGAAYEREVVHRDDLVVLSAGSSERPNPPFDPVGD